MTVQDSEEPSTMVGKLSMTEMKKAIPREAFVKNLWKSMFYFVFDYMMWGIAAYAMQALVGSSVWQTLPVLYKSSFIIVYWSVAGFFMWCQFVVGHDCGHGNFSTYPVLNDIIGHISHGSILVPYFPWQLSHRRHHMYHNHVEKDYSFPWYTDDKIARGGAVLYMKWFDDNSVLKFFMPFYGWFIYLLGIGDGNHFIPLPYEKMWKDTELVEYWKCLFSTAVVLANGWAIYLYFDKNLSSMAFYYLAPLVVSGWWLFTVTFLQHHSPNTVVYDEHDWKFADSAFETVDREYGYGIDFLHHNITDGHVAHHLFYTQIPHYNLPIATKAIREYLKEKNLYHLYRFEKSHDFFIKVHQYFVEYGFRAKKADIRDIREERSAKKIETDQSATTETAALNAILQ